MIEKNFRFDLVEDVDKFVSFLKTNNYDSVIIINDFMQDYVSTA